MGRLSYRQPHDDLQDTVEPQRRLDIVRNEIQYHGVGDAAAAAAAAVARQYLVNHRGAGNKSNGILNTV